MSNIRRMTPEDVAKYAQQDSRALSEVADTDILDELKMSREKLDGSTIENFHFKDLIERYSPIREDDLFYFEVCHQKPNYRPVSRSKQVQAARQWICSLCLTKIVRQTRPRKPFEPA